MITLSDSLCRIKKVNDFSLTSMKIMEPFTYGIIRLVMPRGRLKKWRVSRIENHSR